MKIPTTVGYAIAALVQLAIHRGNQPLSNTTICDRTGMPQRNMLQVLRELGRAGIVASVRGIQGGYRLAKPADQISLFDIVEAVEGPFTSDIGFDGFAAASQKLLAGAVADVIDDARRHLRAFTLDKLQASKA
jgi:Rrf2 family protein